MTKHNLIKQEAQRCLRRFQRAGTKKGDLVLFFHHGIPMEPLPEPFKRRIEFIQTNKAEEEHRKRIGDKKYKSPIPPEHKPPLDAWEK